ncbi:aldo/keto reductase [Limosilactobacillus sp. c9Ua_26_M]|uniref:Aldo/keto reductase n=2 Tax=Limosilactobacillus TaxID=2742598 RepID=A0ABR8ZIS3_9LACO|nr:aldo/keto reductase [Limosilactobacillus urinaemulieris]MBD8085194.1 aldo/keto reductase [Limosilactobacillus urinaemulieris]
MIELTDINSKMNLNNGTQIPCVGYGTFRTPADVAEKAVADAIKVGYRHIDTAAVYGNEEAIGKGIKDSGIDREDLFVTSKLWNDNRGYESTKKAFQETLDRLQMDYLDLYLIHWPANQKQFGTDASKINAETWRAMEDLYKEGKIKAIGLSNFMPHHIVDLMKIATVAPAVDQIEVHPGWPHTEQVKYLQAHNILVEAWAPLGGQGASVMTNPTILQIADKYDKTPAQVSLRWIIQQGIVPLPKSIHENRMVQNTEIFDFTLTDEEMRAISLLTNLGGQCADPDDVDF